jgi:SulP family sulfate permease
LSEWRNLKSILKGPRGDVAVLLITFFLTVLIDLTVAIEVGIVLAAFLFMRDMIRFSDVNILTREIDDDQFGYDVIDGKYQIPRNVEVFEITGPLFFGAAYKFKDAMQFIDKTTKVLIIRMRHVPIIDATGIQTLKEVYTHSKKHHKKIILSEINSTRVMKELKDARLIFAIGKGNVVDTFEKALSRAQAIVEDKF